MKYKWFDGIVSLGGFMNTTAGDKRQEQLGEPMVAAGDTAKRQWVKPVLERLSLKDALGGCSLGSDGPSGAS
jgi:hypothetical protein